MSQAFLQGDPPIALTVRRSARARRMTLRVSRMDGRVTLTLPQEVADSEGLAFAGSRAEWIRKHLADQEAPQPVKFGGEVPVLGVARRIVPTRGKRLLLDGDNLHVPGDPEQLGRRVQVWLRHLARRELAAASDHFAQKLGVSYTKLSLRDTRSRWGSCSQAGRLMYSWRLVMAPHEVLSYVAAHEVAHLRQMNHSRAFWQLVEEIYGPPDRAKNWLRLQGHGLHAVQF